MPSYELLEKAGTTSKHNVSQKAYSKVDHLCTLEKQKVDDQAPEAEPYKTIHKDKVLFTPIEDIAYYGNVSMNNIVHNVAQWYRLRDDKPTCYNHVPVSKENMIVKGQAISYEEVLLVLTTYYRYKIRKTPSEVTKTLKQRKCLSTLRKHKKRKHIPENGGLLTLNSIRNITAHRIENPAHAWTRCGGLMSLSANESRFHYMTASYFYDKERKERSKT